MSSGVSFDNVNSGLHFNDNPVGGPTGLNSRIFRGKNAIKKINQLRNIQRIKNNGGYEPLDDLLVLQCSPVGGSPKIKKREKQKNILDTGGVDDEFESDDEIFLYEMEKNGEKCDFVNEKRNLSFDFSHIEGSCADIEGVANEEVAALDFKNPSIPCPPYGTTKVKNANVEQWRENNDVFGECDSMHSTPGETALSFTTTPKLQTAPALKISRGGSPGAKKEEKSDEKTHFQTSKCFSKSVKDSTCAADCNDNPQYDEHDNFSCTSRGGSHETDFKSKHDYEKQLLDHKSNVCPSFDNNFSFIEKKKINKEREDSRGLNNENLEKKACVHIRYTCDEFGNCDDSLELNAFFNKLPVRVVGSHLTPLFYAADVGTILGISNIRREISHFGHFEIVSGNQKHELGIKTYKQNGIPYDRITLLTEFGVYRLLANNNTMLGEQFREWFYTVMHKIRTTGKYESDMELQKTKTENESLLAQTNEFRNYITRLTSAREKFINLCEKICIFEIFVDPKKIKQTKNVAWDDLSSDDEDDPYDTFDHIDMWDAYEQMFPDDANDRKTAYKITSAPQLHDYKEYSLAFHMYVRDGEETIARLADEMMVYTHGKQTATSIIMFCHLEKITAALHDAVVEPVIPTA